MTHATFCVFATMILPLLLYIVEGATTAAAASPYIVSALQARHPTEICFNRTGEDETCKEAAFGHMSAHTNYNSTDEDGYVASIYSETLPPHVCHRNRRVIMYNRNRRAYVPVVLPKRATELSYDTLLRTHTFPKNMPLLLLAPPSYETDPFLYLRTTGYTVNGRAYTAPALCLARTRSVQDPPKDDVTRLRNRIRMKCVKISVKRNQMTDVVPAALPVDNAVVYLDQPMVRSCMLPTPPLIPRSREVFVEKVGAYTSCGGSVVENLVAGEAVFVKHNNYPPGTVMRVPVGTAVSHDGSVITCTDDDTLHIEKRVRISAKNVYDKKEEEEKKKEDEYAYLIRVRMGMDIIILFAVFSLLALQLHPSARQKYGGGVQGGGIAPPPYEPIRQ